uniref:C2H2-type domain-containing protein n=1 Tax=Lygus hesperus TaxID=30085 RepID=A0A0A9WGH2_LYGHE
MDSLMPVSPLVKSEPGMPVQVIENEELIVPNSTASSNEGPGVIIKKEPMESVSDGEVLENPYQCFTCGLDCESQHELIIHYESKCWTQDVGSNSESMEADGGDDVKAEETDDDPLIGDEAPSNERIQNIGHAFDNGEGAGPQQLLFYCAFCGVASNEKQELMVHMESHVEVTYLSCAHCVHVYSDKYHLKNYKCRDEFEKPHVCVHCPFRTQWWQELKDHCFSHHHSDMNPSQDANREASLSLQAATVPQNRFTGSSPSIHSTESLVNPNSNLENQVMNVHHANKDYVVVIKNLGPTGSAVNSNNLETSGNPSATARLSSNEDYLKQLLVSNSMNAVTGPLLQSSKYLNSVSPTKPNKRKTPPLVPVSAILQPSTPQHVKPDLSFSPVKSVILSAGNVVPEPAPIVAQSWPANVRNIAPRPPNVPGPQNLPTVIPREPQRPQVVAPPKPVKSSANRIHKENAKKKITHVNKKIPCPYCEYLSRDKWNLRTHILTHTKEKPFACQLCSYRASQAAHLRKHMQIHGRKMLGK